MDQTYLTDGFAGMHLSCRQRFLKVSQDSILTIVQMLFILHLGLL